MASSIWDGLGPVGIVSTARWSCIGRVTPALSVGVAIFPENGHTAEELLRNADAAMYTVKDSGRNSLCVFDESLMTKQRATASTEPRGLEGSGVNAPSLASSAATCANTWLPP